MENQNENSQVANNLPDLDSLSKERTFENIRLNKKLTRNDTIFLVVLGFVMLGLAFIIFGIWYAFAPAYSWIPFLFFLTFYGGSILYFLKNVNGKKRWELLYGWLKFRKKPKVIKEIEFERDFMVKAFAKSSVNENNIEDCNVLFLSDKFNAGPTSYMVKVELQGINTFSNLQDAVDKIIAWTDTYNELNRLDQSHGLSISFSVMDSDKFDTSLQQRLATKALNSKTNPIALTICSEYIEMYKDVAGFFTPENQPLIFQNEAPFNLKNHYFVFTIKGNTLPEARRYTNMFIQSFYKNFGSQSKITPISYIDFQNIFNKIFGKITNFEELVPYRTNMKLGLNEEDMDVYLVTHIDKKKTNLQSASSLFDRIKEIKQTKEYLEIVYGDKEYTKSIFYKVIGWKDLPNRYDAGWLSALSDSDIGIFINQNININKSRVASKKLQKQIRDNNKFWEKNEALSRNDEYQTNRYWNDKQQSINFAKAIFDNEISLLGYRFSMLLRAESEDELRAKVNTFDDRIQLWLGLDETKWNHYEYQQYEAFLSVFPHAIDLLSTSKVNENFISSVALAQAYPFKRNTVFLDEGVVIAIDNTRENLITLNPLDAKLTNSYCGLICATSGSGKSKLMQELNLGFGILNKKVQCIAFDPNGDYVELFSKMGGTIIYTDPNENSASPYPESSLAKDHPELMKGYLDKLLSIKRNNEPIVDKQILRSYGPDYFLILVDKNFTSESFGIYLDQNASVYNINNKDKEKIKELYKEIYQRCVNKFLLNPFRIQDTIGERVSSGTGITVRPSALDVYLDYKRILGEFFMTLLKNVTGMQSLLIDEAIDKTYTEVCGFRIVEDLDGNQFLSKSSSREDEVSLSELLDFPTFPVFNDFYKQISQIIDISLTKESSDTIRDEYLRLKSVFLPFVTLQTPMGVKKGNHATIWNTDNKAVNFNNDYVCFVTDYIAKTQENIEDNNVTSIHTTTGSIGRAMFYLLVTLFRTTAIKNGIANKALPEKDKKYIVLTWDEAHNLIKSPMIEANLLRIVKEGRKYKMGAWIITQDLGDITKLKYGDEILNQFQFKIMLGMTPSGIQELEKILKPIGGVKVASKDKLTNPLHLDMSGIFYGNINTKPPGHGILMLNGADANQIGIRTFYTRLSEIATTSNAYSGRITSDMIWDAADRGVYPKGTYEDTPSPISVIDRRIIDRAKKVYYANLNKQSQDTMQQINKMTDSVDNKNLNINFDDIVSDFKRANANG